MRNDVFHTVGRWVGPLSCSGSSPRSPTGSSGRSCGTQADRNSHRSGRMPWGRHTCRWILLPVAVGADARLQGHADDASARPVLPRPVRRAGRPVGHRPRALALLDEHLPVVAARTPVPLIAHNGEINTVKGNRNWMRAREAMIEPPRRRSPATSAGSSRSAHPARPTRRRSTRCSSCCTSAGSPAARRAHDDPRGVGEPRRHDAARRKAFYRYHSMPHGAVGRPGLRSCSPTAPSSARCSTATVCARAATG
jgi:hypothetical protein